MIKHLFSVVLLLLTIVSTNAQRYNFKTYNVPDGLVHSTVSAICEGKNGFMWFGTYDGGVSRFDGISFENFTNKNGLPSNRVLSILSDQDGILWIGTEDAGLVRYDGISFEKYSTEEGLLSNTVTSILNDDEGKLWTGTSKGVNIFANDSLYNCFPNFSP